MRGWCGSCYSQVAADGGACPRCRGPLLGFLAPEENPPPTATTPPHSNGGGSSTVTLGTPMARQHAPDLGEVISISERLIVSPCWGRLDPEPLSEGETVEEGSVIGRLYEGGRVIPLVCHTRSVFLAWLAFDGERVPPGRRVARLAVE
ncbi:MAG: hypothetical protein ACRDKB_02595 [Actinomycetota bacterium]